MRVDDEPQEWTGDSGEEEVLPWPVFIQDHALERAKAHFNLRTNEEAEAFIRSELGRSSSTRRRRDNALRWTTDTTQIVTRQDSTGVWVITCYPKPKGRSWPKDKKTTWRSPRRTKHMENPA